jgi:hypothetical protein
MKAMTEPEKVIAPMPTPSDSSTSERPLSFPVAVAMPKGLRLIERGGGHEHGAQADKRVERGDQLGHVRHRDAAGDHRADAAANGDRAEDQNEAQTVKLDVEQTGADGDRHAGHAQIIALAGGFRARQAPQGHDEQNARDHVENCGEIG